MIVFCEVCRIEVAPDRWHTDVQKLKQEVEKLGGEVRNARYVCMVCCQKYIYTMLGRGYMALSTPS